MRTLLALFLLIASLLGPAATAQESRDFRIRFPAGQTSTTISDRLYGYETVNYRLGAKKGQVMAISLTATSGAVYFNVFAPGRGPGDTALARSDVLSRTVVGINRFQGTLPASGDYTIQVYQVRAAARRGENPRFSIKVDINGGAVQLPGGGSVPTGDAAWFRVSGLSAGDTLNVREGPSTSNRVLYRLRNGVFVRNLGCRTNASGAQWCRIHRQGDPQDDGWASARYLSPARGPGSGVQLPEEPPLAGQLPGDVPMPGPKYDATGKVNCVINNRLRRCDFGVVRYGRGNATVDITMPSGSIRSIEFEGGRPVSSNSQAGIYGEFIPGGTVEVYVGTNERYTVFDEIMFGG